MASQPEPRCATSGQAKASAVVVSIASECGIRLHGTFEKAPGRVRGTALLISAATSGDGNETGAERAAVDRNKQTWHEAGFATMTASCRDLPKLLPIVGVPDHTAAEWGLWVGRPLLGQWVWDIIRWLDFLDQARGEQRLTLSGRVQPSRPFVLSGRGAMGLSALLAAALDDRVAGVCCDGALVSFVAEKARPWSGIPMGVIVPNILDVGDVGHVAALVAPRPIVISRAIDTDGALANGERTRSAFAFCRAVYQLTGAADRLKLSDTADSRELITEL